jgi:hypothetical protein
MGAGEDLGTGGGGTGDRLTPMAYVILIVLLQVACIVHVFRNGSNKAWIMAIAFLPMVGMIAYAIVEILPGLRGAPRMQQMRAQVQHRIDPGRAISDARKALELSDTVGNRLALGDAIAVGGAHDDALVQYRLADQKSPRPDPVVTMRIATTAMEAGHGKEARAALDRLPDTRVQSDIDKRSYVRARIAESEGDVRGALHLYEEMVLRVAGDEVRCRMAALHIEIGDKASARQLLEEVQMRARHLPKGVVREDAEMYAWAKRTLETL